jgi:hypothetical protein
MWPVRNHAEQSVSLLALPTPYTIKSISLYYNIETEFHIVTGFVFEVS